MSKQLIDYNDSIEHVSILLTILLFTSVGHPSARGEFKVRESFFVPKAKDFQYRYVIPKQ